VKFLSEFKAFALKGNVVDLAVAVIVGGAFQKIVSSLVNDILMPFIGLFLGGISFSQLFISLDGKHYDTLAEAEKAGAGVIRYGSFIQVTFDFLIIAFVIFVVVKLMSSTKKPDAPAAPAAPPEDILLLREIRDSLKK